jgi:oxygen-independent coproporphyrinogen-3 oxidase
MNALRLTEGFALPEFTGFTGLPGQALLPALEELAGEGLMECCAGRWRPTARGFQYLNDLLQHFLPRTNSRTGAGS